MKWHGLWFPGMWLMRRLRMASKLWLLAAIALVPLGLLQWQLLLGQGQQLQQAQSASLGAALIADVSTTTRLVQNLRGQTQLWLAQDSAAGSARSATQSALAQAVQAFSARVSAAPGWSAQRDWAQVASHIQALGQTAAGANAAQSFSQHSAAVDELQLLAMGMALDSGLQSQGDAPMAALAQWAAVFLPQWQEQLARLRGQGAATLRQGALTQQSALAVLALAEQLDATLRGVRYWQGRLALVPGLDKSQLEAALAQSAAFIALSRERFGAVDAAGADAGAYFAAGSQALDRAQVVQGASLAVLSNTLDGKVSQIRAWYLGSMVLSGFCVLLLAYLMVALRKSVLADLGEVLLFLQQMAEGNLRHRAKVLGRDELSHMSQAMERMVSNFSSMVASVRSNAALVLQSGTDLVAGSDSLAGRTEQQAANLEQTNASVQELSANVQNNAAAAQESDTTAKQVRDLAENGAQNMALAVSRIEAIQESTRRMDEIVAVIDGLAFQTNILALNAAVEAARAGESGRGFAVVASEVRSLAQRSASSAKEIRTLIATSTQQVGAGVDSIRAAESIVGQVLVGIRSVAEKMEAVSSGSAEQSLGLSEISSAVKQLDHITQQNAAMVESEAHQISALQEQAHTLSESVAVFQLQQGTADEARALVDKALEFKARCHSREEFLRGITNPQGDFFARDMYVFVLDPPGHYLAFGGNLAKVNTLVQSIPGIDGQGLVDDIWQQARSAPGWVQYDITNPSTGKIQTKMSYVVQIEPEMVVGCGVYKHYTG